MIVEDLLYFGVPRDGPDGEDRWLYVQRPDSEGNVEVGITQVYTKWLTPTEARAMAAALNAAADEGDHKRAERDARFQREARCIDEHGGGHDVDWATQPWACRRCGSTKVTTTTGSLTMPAWLRTSGRADP